MLQFSIWKQPFRNAKEIWSALLTGYEVFFLTMSGPHKVGLRLGATLKFTLLCHAFAIVTPLQRKL